MRYVHLFCVRLKKEQINIQFNFTVSSVFINSFNISFVINFEIHLKIEITTYVSFIR